MRFSSAQRVSCASLALALTGCWGAAETVPGLHPDTIELPQGFECEVYAADVPGARSLCWGAEGTLFVGTRDPGKVYAVLDDDGDQKADRVLTLASGLWQPNGVAFLDGALYVAEVNRILRYDGIEARLEDPPEPVVVTDELPDEEAHGWKFIAFGPDGLLYVPVGAPGNHVHTPDDERFSSILRMQPDGTDMRVFAHGIRNTVGFDWRPETGVLWFTDNGQDWMGDDQPGDELNRAPEPGLHFGYPHWHADGIEDPTYGNLMAWEETTPPVQVLGPHVAALGMRFYTGEQFPEEYRGQVFIAEHGSWNRAEPIGYRVTLVRLEGTEAVSYEPFATGWLGEEGAWGRPVDVLVAPDGALLVSDDRAGAIYRISYAAE